MRTIETKVYLFNELNEAGKQNAINLNDVINVNFDWWECTYEDASNIGLKITSFDLDRGRHAEGNFIFEAKDVIDAILENHGESCETYKTATEFKKKLFPLIEKESKLEYRNYDLEAEIEDLTDEFLQSILEDYSIILQEESEYLQSDEYIIETIIANQYEFTEEGNIF